jgi:hypothetical protein
MQSGFFLHNRKKPKKHQNRHYSPLHDVPFPLNPFLQGQLNDPSVLVQVAFLSQLCVFSEHSFISVEIEKYQIKSLFATNLRTHTIVYITIVIY